MFFSAHPMNKSWRCYGNPRLLKHKQAKNKTWSLASNSCLSRTFAFRKLKVQKLWFLLPNIILGLEKMSPKFIFGQKKILVLKKIQVKKKFGLGKILVGKNFGSEKNFWTKKNFGPEKKIWAWEKFWAWKSVWFKKNIWVKKNLGLKKVWIRKKSLSQKILGPTKIWAQNLFFLFFFFLWDGPLTP